MELADLLFSFSEKLDIAIASANTAFDNNLPEFSNCSELIIFLLEFIGSTYILSIDLPNADKRKSSLRYLYRIALGMFDSENESIYKLDKPNSETSIKNCKLLYQCNCLEEIIKVIFDQLDDLEKALRNAGNNLEDISLLESEQEIRISMSILGLITIHCSNDKDFLTDLINPQYRIEELCLKAFKMSLDIAVIPIKRFLLLYCIYLDGLFGGPPKHTVEPVRCVTKEVYIAEFRKKQEKGASSNAVEEFYVNIERKYRNDMC